MASVKVGNFVRAVDSPLATIIQTAPVYVTFALQQGYLPDLRQALASESATIEAIIPGEPRRASGQVTMIENSVDAPTGTVPVRATMPNADELLVDNDVATVRPVEVTRVLGSESVLASGLDGGETVVTNGQLLLSNGTKVSVRAPKVGS
jgi:multidrug efflux pump subunit AcrA (membrane-fusion protein)